MTITQETTTKAKTSAQGNWISDELDCYKIVCPFFRDLNEKTIRCEGIIPGTKTATSFGSSRAMKRYRRCFCNTFLYDKCPLCKALLKKYD